MWSENSLESWCIYQGQVRGEPILPGNVMEQSVLGMNERKEYPALIIEEHRLKIMGKHCK
jgi:hypothetical protein